MHATDELLMRKKKRYAGLTRSASDAPLVFKKKKKRQKQRGIDADFPFFLFVYHRSDDAPLVTHFCTLFFSFSEGATMCVTDQLGATHCTIRTVTVLHTVLYV